MAQAPAQRPVLLMAALLLANAALWLAAFAVFRHHAALLGTALLAYSFGLRHAVDADHIAAIDNVTRKLMQEQKPAAGVGFFFSLGHSTVVFALSAGVAISAAALQHHFGSLMRFGGIAGSLISASFLFGIAIINLVILAAILASLRRVQGGGTYREEDLTQLLAQRGIFSRFFGRLFRLVQRDRHMYLIGLLFGLGFDTATEVGLLGISASAAAHLMPVWSIMLFPALFAAGMALLDTADNLLMLGAYGWAFARPARKLYYNITVTAASVLVALIAGGIELLGLIQNQLQTQNRFWTSIATLNNHFGLLGATIIATFAVCWAISAAVSGVRKKAGAPPMTPAGGVLRTTAEPRPFPHP